MGFNNQGYGPPRYNAPNFPQNGPPGTSNTQPPQYKKAEEDTILNFMKSQASVIEDLKNQMMKLTSTVGTLQKQRGKFSSQPLINPQHQFHQYTNASTSNPPPNHEQAKAITTLRSGREIVRPSNPILTNDQQQE